MSEHEMTTCRFCGSEIERDPPNVDILDYDGDLNFGICDECARKAILPGESLSLQWARTRLFVFPELAR